MFLNFAAYSSCVIRLKLRFALPVVFNFEGVDHAGNQQRMLTNIVPGSVASKCEGLSPGMVLFSIMGIRAVTLSDSTIDRLLLKRPLRLSFEAVKAHTGCRLKAALDGNQDGVVSLGELGEAAGSVVKGGLEAIKRKFTTKSHSKVAHNKAQHGVKVRQLETEAETSGTEVSTASKSCLVTVFLERRNNHLFASFNEEMHCDTPRVSSLWVISEDNQPEEESDTLARSSRYTPHLKALQNASQARGDDFACSAMLTQVHSSNQQLEMITGSGSSVRAWDIRKGECARELKFPGARLKCLVAAANIVFSGSGRVLTGTDVRTGKKIPGVSFMHNNLVTCVDAVELKHKDTRGRPMVACVSGSDDEGEGGIVRLWVSDESSSIGSVLIGDNPQTFQRVGMPGIGVHPRGAVRSLCIWPQNPALTGRYFHYYRLVIIRTEEQCKDVRSQVGDHYETKPPSIGIANFKLLSSAKKGGNPLSPTASDGMVSGDTVLVPTSAMNLSYSTPISVWDADKLPGISCSFEASDPENDRQNSFVNCGAGVLELYFERPVCADEYTWEAPIFNALPILPPERWTLFASRDWVNWVCVDDDSVEPGSRIGVHRDILFEEDAVITLAPSASPNVRHVPMVVSTGMSTVRVWSVCADFTTRELQQRGTKGVPLGQMIGHEDDVTCCSVTKRGTVISGSRDCTVRMWHAHSGKCLEVLRASSPILCVTTFDSPSSAHLHATRMLLRRGAPLRASIRYSIRHFDSVQGAAGTVLLSSGHEMFDSLPIPSFGEAGEDSFEAYAWQLEAAAEPNSIYISCKRDDDTLYLSHDSGNVVLAAVEYRSSWMIEWRRTGVTRPCQIDSFHGGLPIDALVELYPFYRIQTRWRAFSTPGYKGDAVDLLPGTVIQICGETMRPHDDRDTLWQQVVVVGEECDVSLLYQKRVGGWVPIAHHDDRLIDKYGEPMRSCVTFCRLRCTSVPLGQPAYLARRETESPSNERDRSRNSMYQKTNATHSSVSKDDERIDWQLSSEAGFFKFEEALPETVVVAGCEDGSAKIWSNATVGGRWASHQTNRTVKHAGAIQQVHLVATTDPEASSDGILLITCSREVHDPTDQTIAIWRIDSGVWSCVCRLHPMVVQDYIAGMVKYTDPYSTTEFKVTYADRNVTSLTANDLLRIRTQYQSLFQKLIKSLRLVHAQESIAERSHSRALEPGTSFKRERKGDPIFEDGDCYYWIQSSEYTNGHGPTFVADQRLTIEDCEVGMIIREVDTPSDRIGGLFVIISIEAGHNTDAGFFEKIFSTEHTASDAMDNLVRDGNNQTITVSKLDDVTGQHSIIRERGRHPGEFTQAGFWEGFQPTRGPDWILFFLVGVPFDWSVWLKERDIGIVQLISFVFSWPALLWSYHKRVLGGDDDDKTFDATNEDTDWARLFEHVTTGQPVEPMVVPLPDAAGMYTGAQKRWENLVKFKIDDAQSEDASLLHALVSYCDEHVEENNSLLGLEVPETIVQFKWYKYAQQKTMEDLR